MTRASMSAVALGLSFPALAVPAITSQDACTALLETRGQLVAMLYLTDRAAQDDTKAKVHAASAKLDDILAAMMTGSNAAKAAEFKLVWEDFKHTRETEIIPAILAGKSSEAKTIAAGIQADRIKKMNGVMGCK